MEGFDPSVLDELDFLAAQPASPKSLNAITNPQPNIQKMLPMGTPPTQSFVNSGVSSAKAVLIQPPIPQDLLCPLSKRLMEVHPHTHNFLSVNAEKTQCSTPLQDESPLCCAMIVLCLLLPV